MSPSPASTALASTFAPSRIIMNPNTAELGLRSIDEEECPEDDLENLMNEMGMPKVGKPPNGL